MDIFKVLKKVEEQELCRNREISPSSIPGELDKVQEVRVRYFAGTKFILIF